RVEEMIAAVPLEIQRFVHMRELALEERFALVMARFGNDPAAQPLVEQILARAGGNPFFLRELIESLVERGVVAQEGNHLVWVRRDAELQVPSTVEAVVASRLDGLGASEKAALLHASVLGQRIVPTELSALAGRDVSVDLERLIARGLVDKDGKGGYAFHNQIISEVAYAALPEEERRELHGRATRLLAHKESARPEDDAVLARHAAAAGDREEAVRRYLLAARAARDVAGNKLAFEHLSRARKLLVLTDHER